MHAEIKLAEASVGYDERQAEARGVLKFVCDKAAQKTLYLYCR